jgi:hypothetical protein
MYRHPWLIVVFHHQDAMRAGQPASASWLTPVAAAVAGQQRVDRFSSRAGLTSLASTPARPAPPTAGPGRRPGQVISTGGSASPRQLLQHGRAVGARHVAVQQQQS